MAEDITTRSHVYIRAVMGRGASDNYTCVEVPNQGALEESMKEVEGILTRDDTYSNLPTAYTVVKHGIGPDGFDPNTDLEYAAVWVPGRQEWVGIEVERTIIYEGAWQGYDQMIECRGPFRLPECYGAKILDAFGSSKKISAAEILKTDTGEF